MFQTMCLLARRPVRRTLAALILTAGSVITFTANVAHAAPGTVLAKVVVPFQFSDANAVAVDQFDRTVIVGSSFAVSIVEQVALTRYNADDTLDTTFGNNGLAVVDNGNVDTTGTLDSAGTAVAIDHQGRIVVAGYTQKRESDFNFIVARFLDNGQPDTSFNGKGWQEIDFGGDDDQAWALVIDFDDSIYVGGQSFQSSIFGADNDDLALAKLKPNGQLDSSFGGDGKVITGFGHNDWIQAMTFDRLHRLIVVGASWEPGQDFANIILACYKPDGDLLQGFNNVTHTFNAHYSWPFAVAVDDSNRIVVGGVSSIGRTERDHHGTFLPYNNGNFALARFNDNGTPDTSFGDGGVSQTDLAATDDLIRSMAIDRRGRIVVGGITRQAINSSGVADIDHFAVLRYDTNGAIDPFFGDGGVAITEFTIEGGVGPPIPMGTARGLALDSHGRIIVVGSAAHSGDFMVYARFDVEHPDYAVSTPSPLIAPIGQATTTPVTVNSIEGFFGNVGVTLSGGPNGEPLPAGLKSAFNGINGDTTQLQVPVDGSAATPLTITVTPTVAPQQFTLWLRPDPDPAGTHAISFTVSVVAQAGNIVSVVDTFRAANAIDNDAVATSLKSVLNNAQAAANAGDVQTATQQLTGFLIVVETQRGRHIRTSATIDGVSINPVALLLADGRNAVASVQLTSPQHPIVGYITSQAGQALAGATVTLFDAANQPVASAISDVSGLYRFTQTTALTPGAAYTAKVTAFIPIFSSSQPASQTFTWQSTGVALAPFVLQPAVPKP